MVLLQDQGQPDADAVGPQCEAELDRSKDQHARIFQGGQQRGMRPLSHFGGEDLAQHIALVSRQPVRGLRTIGKQVKRHETQWEAWQADQDEKPLPSGQPPDSVHLQQHAAHRAADQRGCRNPDQKPRQHPGAELSREPGGEKEGYAWKEPGFRDAQQKAQSVETAGTNDKGGRRRHQAPADHDAGEPAPRAVTVEHQVARHLKQRIAQKENTRGQTELTGRQPQLLIHGQGGKTETGAIEIIKQVGDRQQRHEAQRGFPDSALQHGFRTGRVREIKTVRDALL